MSSSMTLFDRRLVRLHRKRAAARLDSHDFLFAEAAARLLDRLLDMRRNFAVALNLGGRGRPDDQSLHNVMGRLETLVHAEAVEATIRTSGPMTVVADDEALPFGPETFDLVLSCCSLHWINDLPGTLTQIRHSLRPDGLFLAVLFGGETLHELRRSWLEAEAEIGAGASPHVSPFVDLRTAAGLLQRAGFALPVADLDRITVTYGDALALMRDLRGMGESNALQERKRTTTGKALVAATAAHYERLFGDEDGRIPATFELLFLTGWAPHESQQQPLRPGTSQARLADALDTDEQSAGEKPADQLGERHRRS